MIAVFLIGFILIAQLTLNATANASGALIGSAATNWTNFVTLLWVAVGLLAFTPLINFARINAQKWIGANGIRRFVRCNTRTRLEIATS